MHSQYMSSALQLAERGRFTVSPNPMVGCVIIKNDNIVGQGFHHRAGEPHAEIHALREAGTETFGATAYVTLEPCCHHGRTPPCTEALIKAGIKKVVIACLDPNPMVSGKGVASLQAAGISVEVGVLESEAKQLNEIFFHYILQKRPFVIAKWAMSLDGKTITHEQDTKTISCVESHQSSHELRLQVDGILIGANTALQDNPLLTARYSSRITPAMKQPARIILASKGNLPLDLKLFDSNLPGKTLVATTHLADKSWLKAVQEKQVEVMILPQNESGRIHLPSLLDVLGQKEITSVLVEGGMTLHENFFKENLTNKIHVYLAPVIIGSLEKKRLVTNVSCSQNGRDFCFVANDKGHPYV